MRPWPCPKCDGGPQPMTPHLLNAIGVKNEG